MNGCWMIWMMQKKQQTLTTKIISHMSNSINYKSLLLLCICWNLRWNKRWFILNRTVWFKASTINILLLLLLSVTIYQSRMTFWKSDMVYLTIRISEQMLAGPLEMQGNAKQFILQSVLLHTSGQIMWIAQHKSLSSDFQKVIRLW